jgi:hypothetical protein
MLWKAQEDRLAAVFEGLEELVCVRCGVVHSGPGTVLRRGSRARTGCYSPIGIHSHPWVSIL